MAELGNIQNNSTEDNKDIIPAVESQRELDHQEVEAGKFELEQNSATEPHKLLYTIEDTPPWHTCLLMGFQHYLTMAGSHISLPILICETMCIGARDPVRTTVLSSSFFVCGVITLLQTTFGVRLPIVQGSSAAYLVPMIIILTTQFEPCPSADQLANMTSQEYEVNWKKRMSEVSGTIAIASLLQIFMGFMGLTGVLLRWLTPLAIVPTISLVGLSLYTFVGTMASENWGIAVLTIALIILFSQYLENIPITWSRKNKPKQKFYIFKLFPVLLAVMISWAVCALVTHFGLFPEGNKARTDFNIEILTDSPWFIFPYPGQFGAYSASVSGVLGMMIGVVASIVESIGDYYACAKTAGAPPPPVSAINRGIFVEGIGCVMTGLWGSATGSTSFSQNIAAIAITKVGSIRVVQFSAVLMILFSLLGKVGGLFVSIPQPIIGGLLCVMFAVIAAVGLSTLQFVNLNSSRNLFVLGSSLFLGLAIPQWINKNNVNTGSIIVDQLITILCGTSMFVGGLIGFILDNTIPGTLEERGLQAWEAQVNGKGVRNKSDDAYDKDATRRCYDLPIGMEFIRRQKWLERLPMSPTFVGLLRPNTKDSE